MDNVMSAKWGLEVAGLDRVEGPNERGALAKLTVAHTRSPDAGVPLRPALDVEKGLPKSLDRHLELHGTLDR